MAEFTKEQLIKLIKDFPDNAVIEVCDGFASWVNFNPDDHFDVIDLRNNPFVKEPERKKVYLRFGAY